MPSPFPGMDPWLEVPYRWPGAHLRLIAEIQAALNRQLRPKYHVIIEERVYLADDGDDPEAEVRVPDARVTRAAHRRKAPFTSATAGLRLTKPLLVTLVELEVHEPRLEVIDTEGRRVVTVIEIVSPSNKRPRSSGRESFLEKRREIFRSRSHWIEVDLLRVGRPLFSRQLMPPCDYAVRLVRAKHRSDSYVWPISLRSPLPVVAVPLLVGDADCLLDLQAVFTAGYDNAAYDVGIDYSRDPIPPLNLEDAAWADQLLRAAGLRKRRGPASRKKPGH